MGDVIHTIDDFFYLTLDAGLLFWLCFTVYEFRFHWKYRKTGKAAVITGFAILYKCLLAVIDYLDLLTGQNFSQVRNANDTLILGDVSPQQLLMILYCLLVVFIFTRGRRLYEFFLVLMFVPLSDMLRIMSYYFSRVMPDSWNADFVFYVRMFLTILFLILLTWLLKKYFCMLENNLKFSGLVYTGLAAVSVNVVFVLIRHKILEVSFAALVFAMILIILLFFFLLVEKLVQNYNQTLRLEYQEKVEENDRQTILEMEQATAEIRKWRHEYQNQLLLLQSYSEEGKIDELNGTLRKLLDNMPQLEKRVHTGNSELDLVINHWLLEASRNHTDMRIKISVPENLPFRRDALFSLLNNLLSNAMEAAALTEQPFVSVDIHVVKGYLSLDVVNSCLGNILEKNPRLETSKENKFYHGMGITLIRSIADQYNGSAHFSQDGNLFKCKVLLSLRLR